MEFSKFIEGYTGRLDVILMPVFEDLIPDGTNATIGKSGIITTANKSGFSGKKEELFQTLDANGVTRYVLVGLGKKTGFTPEVCRRAYSSAFESVKSVKDAVIKVILPGIEEKSETKEVVYSIALAAYDYDR